MEDKLSILSQSPLFQMLSNAELAFVAELAHTRACAPGEVVVEEGQLGDRLFVITEGEVEVCRGGFGAPEEPLAVLGSSESFGEMGLIEKDSRSATVRARGGAQLLWLSAEDLTAFREAFPNGYTLIIINIARTLAHRLRQSNEQLAAARQAATLTGAKPSP